MTRDRPTAEVDHEDLSWVQSSVDEVITLLQQPPGLPSVPEVSPPSRFGSKRHSLLGPFIGNTASIAADRDVNDALLSTERFLAGGRLLQHPDAAAAQAER